MLTLDFALLADATLGNIDLDSSAWPVVIDEVKPRHHYLGRVIWRSCKSQRQMSGPSQCPCSLPTASCSLWSISGQKQPIHEQEGVTLCKRGTQEGDDK